MMETGLAVETRNLGKMFPRHAGWRGLLSGSSRVALGSISIQVQRGEVFGILGPNGAGKTTLMKILATLVQPNEGMAAVNGLDVVRHSMEVRRQIGLVYGDERTFFWRLSVRENLRFYAALYRISAREARRRADELLEIVGLEHAANVRMHSFSTGMKQRAAIARGLLSNPSILLMDEPTRSLDPVGTDEIQELIRRRVLADRRYTVLLATNNMDEAEALCDRVALINHGRIRLMGTVGELQRRLLSHDRHRLVVSDVPPGYLSSLNAIPGILSAHTELVGEGRCTVELAVEPQSDAVPRAVRCIVAAGGAVWSCTPRHLSLEDIFRLAVHADEEAPAEQADPVAALA